MTLHTKYTYSISKAFPNGLVNSDALTREWAASGIKTRLSHINTSGDTCDIWTVGVLDTGDKQALVDVLIGSHQATIPPAATTKLSAHMKAALPNASDFIDCAIVVTDEASGRVMAVSDGMNWRRVSDNAIVS